MKVIQGNTYYTPQEVAEHLGVCYRTVINHIDEGMYETVTIGKRKFIPKFELDKKLGIAQ